MGYLCWLICACCFIVGFTCMISCYGFSLLIVRVLVWIWFVFGLFGVVGGLFCFAFDFVGWMFWFLCFGCCCWWCACVGFGLIMVCNFGLGLWLLHWFVLDACGFALITSSLVGFDCDCSLVIIVVICFWLFVLFVFSGLFYGLFVFISLVCCVIYDCACGF